MNMKTEIEFLLAKVKNPEAIAVLFDRVAEKLAPVLKFKRDDAATEDELKAEEVGGDG